MATKIVSPYQQFKTDEQVEQDGFYLDYGCFRLKIARAGGSNQKFQKVLQHKFKPHKRAMSMDTMDDDLARKLMAEAYAETIVLAWDSPDGKGKYVPTVIGEDGKPMEFNRANCVKLLLDLPDLFADLQTQANTAANFMTEERAELIKNSKPA
jgi:hypothetical protein